MPHPIVNQELTHLATITRLLLENPPAPPASEKQTVAALLQIREELPNAKDEDKAALMTQYDQLRSLLDTIREAQTKPEVNPDTPYFGHIQVTEGRTTRDLFIGKATRLDHGLRIVDWRNAPVSRIFYRYQEGDEYEEEVGVRTLEGVVKARRTVAIKRGNLERVQSPEGVFSKNSDGVWIETHNTAPRLAGGAGSTALAHERGKGNTRRLGQDRHGAESRRDKHLPDIAGLIDENQFDLITKPKSGFVVIRGTAGSGKTTVALHRIAWMAYEDKSYDSQFTLFLVFSKALRDYVSHVLPALGVHNVRVDSFANWAAAQRRGCLPMLPKSVSHDAPGIVTRIKLHPAMDVALQTHQLMNDLPPTPESVIDDWASVTTDADAIITAIEETDPGAFTDAEVKTMTTWCRHLTEQLQTYLDGNKKNNCMLSPEDDALLLRAWQGRIGALKTRKGRPLRYKHIALDEVQDFTPLEVQLLVDCLDQNNCITLAGDTAQSIANHGGTTSWVSFFERLGVDGTSVNTLRVSYRCSHQVASFGRAILGDMAETAPAVTLRDGPEVELFQLSDDGELIAFLADVLRDLHRQEPTASVALLAPNKKRAKQIHNALLHSEVSHVRLVDDQSFTFEAGVDITDIESVKGLEFDYVIALDVSAQYYTDTNHNRRLLHVAATRALHQLWFTCVGTPSAIVRAALSST